MSTDVKVACLCPEKLDHTDTVSLREALDFHGAMAAKHAVRALRASDPESSDGEFLATLTEHYVVHGIEAWTLKEKGVPIPVTKAAIRQYVLGRPVVAFEIADVADDLYSEAVLFPLLGLASNSSPPTPIMESTSATTGSEPTPLTPSKRSSTSTTPTVATDPTSPSPAGVSSSSQSSTSAA